MNFNETELTLGLPGESRVSVSGTKRGFPDQHRCTATQNKKHKKDSSENGSCQTTESPTSKVQVVGWPPVRAQRKNIMLMKISNSKYVKVGVDGAPYLRKVDLQMYNSYDQLLRALEGLFTCFTIRSVLNEKKLMDPVNGVGYVPTYEDKDGDWMLVGDVPWEMFAQSCKRLRLMTRSEAIGLGPGTPPKCSSSSC